MKYIKLVSLVMLLIAAVGCTHVNPGVQRNNIVRMHNQVLSELFKRKPDVQAQIARAPGYAVFSNKNLKLLVPSFGGGYGVVRNNRTGRYTYMKMGELGVGLGVGVKDIRLVFVFHSQQVMRQFVEQGWLFSAQADAAAKVQKEGGAVGGEATAQNTTVYQLTETGLALQATIKGAKYWRDAKLN